MKNGDVAYYIDLDGKLIKGEVKQYSKSYESVEIWPMPNMGHIISVNRVGHTIEEANVNFNKWKVEYKHQLLNNNYWINELVEGWKFSIEGDVQPKEVIKIMLEVIKEKTGIVLED